MGEGNKIGDDGPKVDAREEERRANPYTNIEPPTGFRDLGFTIDDLRLTNAGSEHGRTGNHLTPHSGPLPGKRRKARGGPRVGARETEKMEDRHLTLSPSP